MMTMFRCVGRSSKYVMEMVAAMRDFEEGENGEEDTREDWEEKLLIQKTLRRKDEEESEEGTVTVLGSGQNAGIMAMSGMPNLFNYLKIDGGHPNLAFFMHGH